MSDIQLYLLLPGIRFLLFRITQGYISDVSRANRIDVRPVIAMENAFWIKGGSNSGPKVARGKILEVLQGRVQSQKD